MKNNDRHEIIIRECFDNYQWDPVALFPEKFKDIDNVTTEEFIEVGMSVTFEEFREKFLEAINNGEIVWAEFE